jgi:hypothetical protein
MKVLKQSGINVESKDFVTAVLWEKNMGRAWGFGQVDLAYLENRQTEFCMGQ